MARRPPSTPQRYKRLDTAARVDVHDAITAKIVAAIEAGAGEFQMPWHRPGVALTLPRNALTGKPYRGSNILSLWIDADAKRFEHQVWATYRQFEELGAQVRKGEKSSLIVKVGEWTPKSDGERTRRTDGEAASGDEGGEDVKRMFAKAAHVFNIDQVDCPPDLRAKLLPAEAPRPDLTTRLAHVDAFIAAIGVEIREGGQRAFYRHRSLNGDGDFIQMPPRNLFTGTATSCGTHASGMTPTEAYYSTLCHEGIHASGAEHRLNRKFGERFGDNAYSFEELVAELGAAFLCAELHITNAPRIDHAQYIGGWLSVLKSDAKAIFAAASLATRAVDFLMALQPPPDPAPDDDGPSRPGDDPAAAAAPAGPAGGPGA